LKYEKIWNPSQIYIVYFILSSSLKNNILGDFFLVNKLPGNALMALSTCRWKDSPVFLRPKGILLYSQRLKGVNDIGLLHILWVDRDLMISFPQVNLGEDRATSGRGNEIQHMGRGSTSCSVTRLIRQKLLQGRQLPSAFFTMCSRLDHEDLDP
jgi:hypothetical protein